MALRWALAFSVAGIVTLGGAGALRAASHRGVAGVRRRGTLALAGGAVAGWLFLPSLPGRIAVVLAAATVLALFGSAFVTRAPPRALRLIVVTAAAVAAVAAGVRLEWSGVTALDVIGTVVIIVGAASAFRWADATDGLAAALAAAALAGVFALAGFSNQDALATVAASVGGAAVGFLAYNSRPASIYLNRDGALFLGFLVSVLAIEVRPSIGSPGDLAVPFLLLAVPLLEITIVPLGQLRRRKQLAAGRRDHLVHRLALIGIPRWAAVTVLTVAELGLAGVAVFVGRGVLAPTVGVVAGGAVVLVLLVATTARNVYGDDPAGFSNRVRLAVLGLVALVIVLALPAGVAAARARSSVENARTLVERALDAARDGEAQEAEAGFAAAAEEFEDARDALQHPLASGGLAVPVVGPNLRATRELARVGADLSRAGERTAAAADPDKLAVVDGTVPLAEVATVTPELELGARELRRALRRLDALDPAFLVAPVQDAMAELHDELTSASVEADNGVAAARLAPAIFGGEGDRRYLLLVQNSAEQRATGGFSGSWGILLAQEGRVDLGPIEPIQNLNPASNEERLLNAPDDYLRRYARFEPELAWQNINMSPDFETVSQVAIDQYHQATGEHVEGVLAVDPQGLAALLELTGPVRVEAWPDPISAANVVDVVLRDAYTAFENDPQQRDEFLGAVAEAVVDRATEGELGSPAGIARILGRAARGGHLVLGFAQTPEQELAQNLGVAGLITDLDGDSLLVTTQNGGGNKIDYYLRRGLSYEVNLMPDAELRQAQLRGHVELRLENTAPSSGLPRYVIGPSDDRFVAGENRAYVSIYTPLGVTSSRIDGEPELLEAMPEVDRNVYSIFLSIPALTTRTVSLDVAGTVPLEPGGWYTLQLPRQPGVAPDDVAVTISVPSGWRIAETEGLERTDARRAAGEFQLDGTTEVRVRLDPGGGNLWDRLSAGGRS